MAEAVRIISSFASSLASNNPNNCEYKKVDLKSILFQTDHNKADGLTEPYFVSIPTEERNAVR